MGPKTKAARPLIRRGLLPLIALVAGTTLASDACAPSHADGVEQTSSPQGIARAMAARAPAVLRAFQRSHFDKATGPDGQDVWTANARVVVTAPLAASQPIRLAPHGKRGLEVDITLEGAGPISPTADRGVVAYGDVLPSTDLLVTAGEANAEEFLLLRGTEAPKSFAWRVSSPALSRSDAREDGLWLFDAGGDLLIHVPPPSSVDAAGVARRERWEWNAQVGTLSVALDTRALYKYPVLLDPNLELEAWEDVSRPTDVSGQVGVFDEARKNFVVFGGTSANNVASRTWVWDGVWKKPASPTQPVARSNAAMAYDASRAKVVMFGGISLLGGPLSDTWTWDGQAWKEEFPLTPPEARHGASLAFDRKRNKVVLFGGQDGNGAFPETTFTWDGSNWTQVPTSLSPPGRSSAGFAYDPVSEKSYLLGGMGPFGIPKVETWTFNGSDWTAIPWVGPLPEFNAQGARLVFDAPRAKLTMMNFGNAGTQVFAWSGAAWSPLGTFPKIQFDFFPVIAFDQRLNEVIYWSLDSSDADFDRGQFWRWNGTSFKRDPSLFHPPRRAGTLTNALPSGQHLFVPDEGGNKATWLVDPKTRTWTETETSSPPTLLNRGQAAVAYDETRGQGVLFSGNRGVPDTWTWDGTTWTQRSPANAPPWRYRASFVWDPIRKVAWLFGGVGPSQVYSDLWSWDGSNWKVFTPQGPTPPARFNSPTLFDPKRGVVVLFGGYSESGFLDDTWTWDGQTWSEAKGAVRPAQRDRAALSWDDRSERVLLFGGSAAQLFDDVWAWNGSVWTSLVDKDLETVPRARSGAIMVGVPGTGRTYLYGGENGNTWDEWVFHTRGGECKVGSECASGNCVDGACCESAACGVCETCGGVSPGKCTPVRSADDLDTCSAKQGKSCDENGSCKPTAGSACSQNSDCATKHCVDGVCCNTACDAPCEACAASTKLTGTDDGRCGAAALGTNPGGRCGTSATCNAQATCASTTIASCQNDRELAVEGNLLLSCAPYKCSPGKGGGPAACLKRCASVADCVFPASCGTDGRCTTPGSNADDSGCSFGAARGARGGFAAVVLSALAAVAFSRRRRHFRGHER